MYGKFINFNRNYFESRYSKNKQIPHIKYFANHFVKTSVYPIYFYSLLLYKISKN